MNIPEWDVFCVMSTRRCLKSFYSTRFLLLFFAINNTVKWTTFSSFWCSHWYGNHAIMVMILRNISVSIRSSRARGSIIHKIWSVSIQVRLRDEARERISPRLQPFAHNCGHHCHQMCGRRFYRHLRTVLPRGCAQQTADRKWCAF